MLAQWYLIYRLLSLISSIEACQEPNLHPFILQPLLFFEPMKTSGLEIYELILSPLKFIVEGGLVINS